MKIALAAVGFITGNIAYNRDKIISVTREYAGKADMILFGETFLQGFDPLCWEYEKDRRIAVEQNCQEIGQIRRAAAETGTAVSFGYIERSGDGLYSSQMTADGSGEIIHHYRRISAGWKERIADGHYREEESFSSFEYKGKRFSVGLCGDLWDDENCAKMKAMNADIVLWPVYTDFNYREWNGRIRQEYAVQAGKCGKTVLYVNSVCLDREEEYIARGGAAVFSEGRILKEVPAGEESVLIADV
ncbi:MAG: carbon-nitrogen hydrolase family protein [Clostridiales bacterium]|nr:carbon-nitrogen hydrolase family protein [Clostridiales bacterium]